VDRLPASLLLKLLVAGAISFAIVALMPHTVSGTGAEPPVRMLLTTAVLVSIVCALALFWGVRSDLGLPATAAVYVVAFNVLVIVVKLTLGPHGYYETNQAKELSLPLSSSPAAVLAAIFIFLLYAGVYYGLYRLFGGRLEDLEDRLPRPRAHGFVVVVVVGVLLLLGSGGAILIILLPFFGGLEYLGFVFSSAVGTLIALALAAATSLAALAFKAASDRALVVGDSAVFASVFWLGLYFLALYHVLWVVYVLALTSIWPLKVVTAK
jgi:hypothetical protein